MADLLTETTSNINTISQSITSTRSSLSSLSSSVNKISLIISNKTKVRTDLILKNVQIENRRREAAKRKELEDQIEASKVSTNIKSGLNVASSTGKGPLGRILSFLGYLGAGWILENLPTWIAMGKEFIARMRKAGELIYSIPQTMWRILQNFGTLLSSVKQNIINLDFGDSSGEVRDSFKELTDSMQLLGQQMYGGFASLLQPSGEVEIPSTSQQEPDTNIGFPPGTPGQGSRLQPIHKQALDIISKPESGGDYNAMNNGQAGDRLGGSKKWLGKNLTDMTIGEVKYYQNTKKTLWAAGRYQIVPGTLPTAQSAAGLKDSDRFDQNNQDLLAIGLLKVQGPGAWSKYSKYTKEEIAIMYKAKDTPLGPSAQPQSPKPTVTPQTPTVPPPPKSQSGGRISQYFHGEPGRAGYDPKGHWNHDHFSFTTRAAAVKAFEALRAKGFKPYEFEGYTTVSPPPGHSNTGGHYGLVGGKATVDDKNDGTAFDIPYSSYGSGPIGPQDYAKSREAYKIVTAAIGDSSSSSSIASKPQSVATTPLVGQQSAETSSTRQPTEQPYVPTAQELEVQKSFNQELQSIIQGTSSADQPQISPTPTGQFGGIQNNIVPERRGQEILFIDDRSGGSGSTSKSDPNEGSLASTGKSTGRYAGGGNQQGTMLNNYMKQKLLLDLNYV